MGPGYATNLFWNDIVPDVTWCGKGYVVEYRSDPNAAVPEPSSYVLMACVVGAVLVLRRRRRA